ncbi:P12 [Mycoreovirus 3]|uniref:P12 n=1 Tax=Rosellinia necatrix mycoreovirus 3 (isolate W370) TaxID=311229 RepID=Q8JXE8_MYRVW|nr:P12 [Mycoreovirus 3]BAC07525.1 P12 [Mycoreovirus 3]
MTTPHFHHISSVSYVRDEQIIRGIVINNVTYPLSESGPPIERYEAAFMKFIPREYARYNIIAQLPRPDTDAFTSEQYAPIYHQLSSHYDSKDPKHDTMTLFITDSGPDLLQFLGDIVTLLGTSSNQRVCSAIKFVIHGHSWMSQLYIGGLFVPIVSLNIALHGWLPHPNFTCTPINIVTCTDWASPRGLSGFVGNCTTLDDMCKTMITNMGPPGPPAYTITTGLSYALVHTLIHGEKGKKLVTTSTQDGHPASRGTQICAGVLWG